MTTNDDASNDIVVYNENSQSNKEKKEDKTADSDLLASASDVFSFTLNFKTKLYVVGGIFFAVISGCVFPVMAWLLSDSFTDLLETIETNSRDKIRDMAFHFIGLGYVNKASDRQHITTPNAPVFLLRIPCFTVYLYVYCFL